MELLRGAIRTYLAPGQHLQTPWNMVVPTALLGATYLILVRILLPYLERIGRALLLGVIAVSTFALLLPDLISTGVRRSRGLPPASWTFSFGEPILRAQERWDNNLHNFEPKPKQHVWLAIVVIVALLALPIAAYQGVQDSNHPALRSASARVVDWYAHLEKWARK